MAMLIKTPYGHAEVFHSTWYRDDDEPLFDGEGWYWWVYEPGCLPKPQGPFETEREALEDAGASDG